MSILNLVPTRSLPLFMKRRTPRQSTISTSGASRSRNGALLRKIDPQDVRAWSYGQVDDVDLAISTD